MPFRLAPLTLLLCFSLEALAGRNPPNCEQVLDPQARVAWARELLEKAAERRRQGRPANLDEDEFYALMDLRNYGGVAEHQFLKKLAREKSPKNTEATLFVRADAEILHSVAQQIGTPSPDIHEEKILLLSIFSVNEALRDDGQSPLQRFEAISPDLNNMLKDNALSLEGISLLMERLRERNDICLALLLSHLVIREHGWRELLTPRFRLEALVWARVVLRQNQSGRSFPQMVTIAALHAMTRFAENDYVIAHNALNAALRSTKDPGERSVYTHMQDIFLPAIAERVRPTAP